MARNHRPGTGFAARLGIAATTIGLLAATSLGLAAGAAPGPVALAAFTSPHLSGNYIPPGPPPSGDVPRYRGHYWNGDRDHDGGWDGHPWRWWHDAGITAARCRYAGGHVDWDRHRCEGGRYDDFHVR